MTSLAMHMLTAEPPSTGVVRLLHYEVLGFLLLLAVTLGYRAVTGRLMLSGLLSGGPGDRSVAAERVQLLIATIAVSLQYLLEVVHGSGGTMPGVSRGTLLLFGGSGGVYATVKAAKIYLSKSTR